MNKDINAHEHFGCAVDLSVAETLTALESPEAIIAVRPHMWGKTAQVAYELCILFRGEWHEVCRTDLKDDVCTSCDSHENRYDPQKELEHYRGLVRYGARIKTERSLPMPLFAVVDSYSDG